MQSTVDCFFEDLDFHEGKRVWTLTASRCFSTSSAYETTGRARATLMSRKLIWDRRLPCKVSIFMWKLFNEYLPFPETLRKTGFQLPSKCFFCPSKETRNHVLSDCRFASAIWGFYSHALNLPGFSSNGILMRLQHWWSNASLNSVKGLLLIILSSVICREI